LAQSSVPSQQALDILARMTPEERVGQLFLVSFQGAEISSESEIYTLITEYHIGGVTLLAENDNFAPAPDTLSAAYETISTLQRAEWESSLVFHTDSETGDQRSNVYIPLFVALTQEGGGAPYDQILSGFPPLPNEMAIGATWLPDLAEQSGEVLGKELAALGVNLYLGPSLDVLESPNPGGGGDLGTRVFGGDPIGSAKWERLLSGDCIRAAADALSPWRNISPDAAVQTVCRKKRSRRFGNHWNN